MLQYDESLIVYIQGLALNTSSITQPRTTGKCIRDHLWSVNYKLGITATLGGGGREVCVYRNHLDMTSDLVNRYFIAHEHRCGKHGHFRRWRPATSLS